jgi:hypothetical protein
MNITSLPILRVKPTAAITTSADPFFEEIKDISDISPVIKMEKPTIGKGNVENTIVKSEELLDETESKAAEKKKATTKRTTRGRGKKALLEGE